MNNSDFKTRPTKAAINLNHLRNNLNIVREIVGNRKIMGVVKADAYGHGLVEISKVLEEEKIDYLGVAYLEEAIILRKKGLKTPILVLGAINTYQIEEFLINNIELTGASIDKLKEISEIAKSLNIEAKVHVKIDTGMGRIGVQWDRVNDFFEELFKLKNIKIIGIYSHFSSADSDKEYTEMQYERFEEVLAKFSKYMDIKNVLVHIANSSGVCNFMHLDLKDMVRTGLILYGYSDNLKVQRRLKPVMTLKTVVSYFKVLAKGSPVSYNKLHTTKKQTRIVTLPIGYADGYPIEFSNKSKVYLNRHTYPVIGKVCMDQCMVDIDNGEAYVGDTVELFGENINLQDLCKKSGESPYTILTGISLRVPRVYI